MLGGGEGETLAFVRNVSVSRETEERLRHYAALLERWTRKVNLVAPATVDALWTRHILDSAQTFTLAPPDPRLWLDLGTGGGLPGIVCAILAADLNPATRFVLVESDRRKCAFLATCRRELGLAATIHAERIERLPGQEADVISARALAPLPRLISLAAPHAAADAVCLFPKGARHAEEIAEARAHWRFTVEAHPSITDPAARILRCRIQGGI